MKKYKIYVYEFKNSYCYVGLTNNLTRRNSEHHEAGGVFQHSKVFNEEIPEVKVLEDDLDEFEAQASEDNWCKFYVDNGWTLINKAKTGLFTSSLGASAKPLAKMDKIKKSSDLSIKYYECLNEAKKYDTLRDFRLGSNKFYTLSKKYGWSFEWLGKEKAKNNGKRDYSYESIKSEAMKYKTRTEFALKDSTLYEKALGKGYLDDFFPKVNKCTIEDDPYVTDEYIRGVMLSYATKTEFYKGNQKLYNMARIRGLLKEFPTRVKKTNFSDKRIVPINKYGINDFFNQHSDLVENTAYPKYYLDKGNMKLYKKYKTMVAEVRVCRDKHGLLYYQINSSNVPVIRIVRDFLYEKDVNLFSFKNGNSDDVTPENIIYSTIDLSGFREMNELDAFLLNSRGQIYSKRHMIFMPLEIKDDGTYFCGFRVDRLVCKYFHNGFDTLKNIEIAHKDGDSSNNDISNLDIRLSDKYNKSSRVFRSKKIGDKYELSVFDQKNERVLSLGVISNKKLVDAIRVDVTNRFIENEEISQWLPVYQSLDFKEWQKKDKEFQMISKRVSSNGCYYSEVHKLWKSKIWYDGKEYSLGYFHNFESGKVIYEEAVLYIKYNKFETWYNNIDKHRERIRVYFNG